MNARHVEALVNAVLYDGYILTPGRSQGRNTPRVTCGVLMPKAPESGPAAQPPHWFMQAECLARGGLDARLHVRVRWLHLVERTVGRLRDPARDALPLEESEYVLVERLTVNGQAMQPGEEATACDVHADAGVTERPGQPVREPFHLPPRWTQEPLYDARRRLVGVQLRRQAAIDGLVELSATRVGNAQVEEGLLRIVLRVSNLTSAPARRRDSTPAGARGSGSLRCAMLSTHAILQIAGAEFLSQLDPPPDARPHAAACRNVHAWPVLVGDAPAADAMLASPIPLGDYPRLTERSGVR